MQSEGNAEDAEAGSSEPATEAASSRRRWAEMHGRRRKQAKRLKQHTDRARTDATTEAAGVGGTDLARTSNGANGESSDAQTSHPALEPEQARHAVERKQAAAQRHGTAEPSEPTTAVPARSAEKQTVQTSPAGAATATAAAAPPQAKSVSGQRGPQSGPSKPRPSAAKVESSARAEPSQKPTGPVNPPKAARSKAGTAAQDKPGGAPAAPASKAKDLRGARSANGVTPEGPPEDKGPDQAVEVKSPPPATDEQGEPGQVPSAKDNTATEDGRALVRGSQEQSETQVSRRGEDRSQPGLAEESGMDMLRKAMSMIRSSLMMVGAFSVAVNALMLSIPIYLFQVSDRVLTSRSVETLIMLTVIVLGALGVMVILDMMRRFLLSRIAMRLETVIGGSLLGAALKSPNNAASKDVQAMRDLQQVRNFVTGPVALMFFDAPLAPVFFLVVFLIHPHLGLIAVTAGIILIIIALVNQRLTAEPVSTSGSHAIKANLQAEAQARNAQVIGAMGMLNESISLWGRENAQSLKSLVRANDRNVYLTGFSKYLRLSTQVAILGWGGYLALQSELTGGMMIAASIIASRALTPAEGAIEGWRSFVQAKTAYSRIKGLLETSHKEKDRLRQPQPHGRIDAEKLLYLAPGTKQPILNGVGFSLEPGESMAIIGPSGAGKSTLARLLINSMAPTAGTIRLDHTDLRNWDRQQFGDYVGYLPQDVELFPGTIKANIARMREDVSDQAIFKAAELAGVHEMISQFSEGYETEIQVDGSPLSGGQRQRVALARAFFGDPSFVVLDEPNSNLDAVGEEALSRALKIARDRKVSVVTVTQRPAVLQNVDRILMLRKGRIEAFGKRDEIMPRLVRPREPEVNIDPAKLGASPSEAQKRLEA